jgi:hypothetical protein
MGTDDPKAAPSAAVTGGRAQVAIPEITFGVLETAQAKEALANVS